MCSDKSGKILMSAFNTLFAWTIKSWLIWGNKDGSSCPVITTNWQGLKVSIKSWILLSNVSMARKVGKLSPNRTKRYAHWWKHVVPPMSRIEIKGEVSAPTEKSDSSHFLTEILCWSAKPLHGCTSVHLADSKPSEGYVVHALVMLAAMLCTQNKKASIHSFTEITLTNRNSKFKHRSRLFHRGCKLSKFAEQNTVAR